MSEEAAADVGQQSAPQDSGAQDNGGFSVPQEYADRGWAQKIQSYDDLFKSYDNAQSMIGKRVIPADDAPAEQWNEFYKTIGRPESPDGYEFGKVDGLPEGFDLSEFEGQARSIMHEAGLNKQQADKLYQLYLKNELDVANKNKEALSQHQQKLDKEFDEITGELFGENFDKISEKLQGTIVENVPEKYRPMVAEMFESNPKQAAVVMALTDNMIKQVEEVKRKYGAEDNLSSGQQSSGASKEDVLRQLNEAKVKAKQSDPFSPDRKRAEADIEQLRQKLQGFFK